MQWQSILLVGCYGPRGAVGVRARGCALRDLDLAPDAYDLRDADECRAFFARAYANGTAWPVTTNNNIDCHCMSKLSMDARSSHPYLLRA